MSSFWKTQIKGPRGCDLAGRNERPSVLGLNGHLDPKMLLPTCACPRRLVFKLNSQWAAGQARTVSCWSSVASPGHGRCSWPAAQAGTSLGAARSGPAPEKPGLLCGETWGPREAARGGRNPAQSSEPGWEVTGGSERPPSRPQGVPSLLGVS